VNCAPAGSSNQLASSLENFGQAAAASSPCEDVEASDMSLQIIDVSGCLDSTLVAGTVQDANPVLNEDGVENVDIINPAIPLSNMFKLIKDGADA
jgi:hypothetical protein